MRVLRQSIRATTILLLLCGVSFGSGFEITGLGAKARGMGGAFRAIADDWTAAYYNPAGYAFIKDNAFSGNIAFIDNRNELAPNYSAPSGLGQPFQWGHFNDRTIFNVNKVLNNPSGGFVIRTPFWGETVVGLSVYQPFDYSITWNLFGGLSSYNRDGSLIPGEQYKSDIDIVAFQFTAGREFIPDKLSLGIGFQLLRADLLYKDLFLRNNPLSAPLSDRSWDKVPQFLITEGVGYGFGLRGGLLWKPTKKLSIGITAAVPFEITIDGDAESRFIMPDRATRSGFDQFVPGTPEFLFTDGGIKTLNSQFENKIQLPPSFGIGLALQVTEKLLVSFDAEYTLWSEYEGLGFSFSDFSSLPIGGTDDSVASFFKADLSRPVNYDDAGKIMGGFKYDFSNFLSLVGGAGLDQAASSNFNDLTPQFIDTGDKFNISGGILASIDRWDIGLTTSYVNYPDLDISGLQDFNGDGIDDNFPGSYSGAQYETIFSFNYRF